MRIIHKGWELIVTINQLVTCVEKSDQYTWEANSYDKNITMQSFTECYPTEEEAVEKGKAFIDIMEAHYEQEIT